MRVIFALLILLSLLHPARAAQHTITATISFADVIVINPDIHGSFNLPPSVQVTISDGDTTIIIP